MAFFSEEPQDFYSAPEALGEFSGARDRTVRNAGLSVVNRAKVPERLLRSQSSTYFVQHPPPAKKRLFQFIF